MRSRFLLIVLFNIGIILIVLVFHEKILTNIDKILMPDSAELCKTVSEDLIKKLKINSEVVPLSQLEKEMSELELQRGGRWHPDIQSPQTKIAIIVPYRDRFVNLELFLRNIHPFLKRQNAYYGIYVVEPLNNLTFNKGIAMNAGFLEALQEDNYDCFLFHDVDLIPENEKNIYSCNKETPKLLAVAISAFGYSVEGYFKNKYFGGVTAFTKEQFTKINGFSNSYYGWGLEDDDARIRVLNKYSEIARLRPDIGRYYANCHQPQSKNPKRFIEYIKACMRQVNDGVNSVKYKVESVEKNTLFTRLFISYKSEK